MPHSTKTLTRGQRIRAAFLCSLHGFHDAWRHERAFQEEVLVFVLLAIPGAMFLGHTGLERALMLGSWMLVLITELLNSAIETTVDRIGLDHHELSRRAKDIASAAVLASILASLVVWGCILWDH